MAWIELHQTLPKNKKTIKLKRELGIKTPQAVGHLCMLWLWALDNTTDGDISEFTADDIAEVCEWKKDSEKFYAALINAGLIDGDLRIHDWDEYFGRLMAKREVNREQAKARQKRYRERLKTAKNSESAEEEFADKNNETLRNSNALQDRNVTHNNSVSNGKVTQEKSVSNAGVTHSNSTVPYSTVPIYSNSCSSNNIHSTGDEATTTAATESKLNLLSGKIGKGVVMLSDAQVDSLLEELSLDEFNYYVEKLADFIINKNAIVKNHYQTILKWCKEDRKVGKK